MLVCLDSRNSDYFSRGCHDKQFAARLASVIGVDAVVGLLVPDEFQGFVPALGQMERRDKYGIYTFGADHLPGGRRP
jgi:hypothetical protein